MLNMKTGKKSFLSVAVITELAIVKSNAKGRKEKIVAPMTTQVAAAPFLGCSVIPVPFYSYGLSMESSE